MNLSALSLSKIVHGDFSGDNLRVSKFSIDSRDLRGGEVFIALKGSKFDGHDFIKEAFEKGAIGVVSEKDINVPKGKFVIKVDSSLEALRKIASFKRKIFKGKVIGIAGSVGKTTTKELVAYLLSKVGKTYKTPGNLNSQIGLPLAIANAPLDVNFWVLEHGASKRGEIRKLIEITKPHVRLITTIGEEHLEGFGSVDNVIWGNGEMFCGLNNYFNAVIPHGIYNHYSFLPRAWVITFGKKGDIFFDEFVINDGGTTLYISGEEFFVPVPSVGMVENLLASFGVLKSLGYDFKNFKGALRDFKSEKGRMEIICFRNFKVINDTYNANPPSMRNAIKSLNKFKNEKKILILGDMLELGEHSKALHREVGELLNTFKFYTVFFYGKEMIEAYKVYQGKKFYASSKSELIKLVKKSKKMLKDGLILLKGSRGMKLEEIIEVLRGIDNELSC